MTDFAAPSTVRKILIGLGVRIVFPLLVFLFLFEPKDFPFLIVFEVAVAGGYLFVARRRWSNAFCRFTVDEVGIRNKYIGFRWEEISTYGIVRHVDSPNRRRIGADPELPSLICIGRFNEREPFKHQDMQNCVCFSLIKKHLDAIERYGKGKCEAVDRILEYRPYIQK